MSEDKLQGSSLIHGEVKETTPISQSDISELQKKDPVAYEIERFVDRIEGVEVIESNNPFELIIREFASLETLLRDMFSANGDGLNKLISSSGVKISTKAKKALREIIGIRNRVVHHADIQQDDVLNIRKGVGLLKLELVDQALTRCDYEINKLEGRKAKILTLKNSLGSQRVIMNDNDRDEQETIKDEHEELKDPLAFTHKLLNDDNFLELEDGFLDHLYVSLKAIVQLFYHKANEEHKSINAKLASISKRNLTDVNCYDYDWFKKKVKTLHIIRGTESENDVKHRVGARKALVEILLAMGVCFLDGDEVKFKIELLSEDQ